MAITILVYIIKSCDACSFLQGSENYEELEEVLTKHSTDDLVSGIDLASVILKECPKDPELYLLRAKLSYKLLVRLQPLNPHCSCLACTKYFQVIGHQKNVDKHIRSCLEDCEQGKIEQ